MGIQGLIPFIKKASRRVNIKEFSGCTAGIDAYCWLHKGAFGCAEKLGKGQETDGYVRYCIKMLNLLISMKITPIMVFDGRRLPAKEGVELNRREQREKNKRKAKEFLREGKLKEAREHFQRSVDITSQMALDVIKACQTMGVDCIVAPYEADAQLAYLNKKKIVQIVVTEDSDLVLFGCDYILFKMDSMGFGVLVEKSRLCYCMEVNPAVFSFDKFRYMCIMSGCDYLSSLPGIGLAKSCKFFIRVTNLNLKHTLTRIPSYLRMPQLTVTETYINDFMRANNTFLHQLAFDPQLRKLVPLSPYPEDASPSDFNYAGPYFPHEIAYQLALGNVNVHTMEKMAEFDPEKNLATPRTSSWSDKSSKSRISIWSANFKPIDFDMTKSAIEIEKSPTKGKEVVVKTKVFTKIVRQIIDPDQPTDDELTQLYSQTASPPKKKPKTDFSPPPNQQTSEKSLLNQILTINKKSPPRTNIQFHTPTTQRITSKYFTPESKKQPKVDWFDQIADEYDQKPQKDAQNDTFDDPKPNKSPEKENETEKIDKIDEISPKTPSNFNWTKPKMQKTSETYLKSSPVVRNAFKSPAFVRKMSLDLFGSLDSSQKSTNSSVVDNSIDFEEFELSQSEDSSCVSQKSVCEEEIEEVAVETSSSVKKVNFFEKFSFRKVNETPKKKPRTCRQTGLRKTKPTTDLRITTLDKFHFTQSHPGYTRA